MGNQKLFVVGLILACLASHVQAQGLLIDDRDDHRYRLPRIVPHPHPRPHPRPRPAPPSYRIQELGIQVSLQDQIAKVQVSQSFVNTGSRQMEVCFMFPLPYDGAVDRMTFMVDGREYPAKLLDREEARRIYEGYVRRNRDPALMEWVGTGMFKTSVFPVPPGAKRTVTLRYSQLCRTHAGLTELLFPLSTAKYTSRPIERITLDVAIRSSAKIKNIYSPTHAVTVKRTGDHNAQVSFSAHDETPASDFRLLYDVADAPLGASVVSYRPQSGEDGYFLLLVSPQIRQPGERVINKNVVFVVDRSGSMSGKKIEQAKGALRFVLHRLNPGDLFNIIAYDSTVESFQAELQRYDDQTRAAALGFVEGIYAGGSTNIDGALQATLAQLQDNSRPNYIVFLTDGLPTAGERNEARIVAKARQRNQVRARVFSFGVGYDVNSRLLDKISRACFGQSQFVRPDEDIEQHISQLYGRIRAPVLTDMKIVFDMEELPAERGSPVNRVYPREAYDLFAGDQLVVVGRYRQGGTAKVTISGMVAGQPQQFDFPAKLVERSVDETQAFVEKLWALRRVGQIIDEVDLHGKNQELIDELVALSTKHGIITPYTSYLADENADVRDLTLGRRRTGAALDALQLEAGRGGFLQRDIKRAFQQSAQAPVAGDVRFRDVEEDRVVTVRTVHQVGAKTFFLRNGRWVDSALGAAQENHVQMIKRYSKDYFDLAKRLSRHQTKYLALEGEVSVVLDGRAYVLVD